MLRKKALSFVLAFALVLPVYIAPTTYSYAYTNNNNAIPGFADIVDIDDITDEFVNKYKDYSTVSLSAPIKKDMSGKLEDIKNLQKLKDFKNIQTLRIASGSIDKSMLKDLVKYLPKLERLTIKTNEFMDLGDLVDNNIRDKQHYKKIEQIVQEFDIDTAYTKNIIDNPIKIRGEYAVIASDIIVENTNEKKQIDVSDRSKIKIAENIFNELVKDRPAKLKLEYSKTFNRLANSNSQNSQIKDVEYRGYIHLVIDKAFKIDVENGKSDMQEAKKGDTITLTADKINSENRIFDKWESDDVEIKEPHSLKASFVMPREDVKVKAKYRDYKRITKLEMTTDTILIPKDETTTDAQLYLKVEPEQYDGKLKWDIEDKNIATVDDKGNLRVVTREKGKHETKLTVTAMEYKNVNGSVQEENSLTTSVMLKLEIDKLKQEQPQVQEQQESQNNKNDEKKPENDGQKDQNQSSGSSSSGSSSGGGGGGSAPQKSKEEVKKEVKEETKQEENANEKIQEKEITVKDIMTNEKAEEKVSNLKDVSEITWSKQAITKVIQKGIMQGDTNGNFNPKANITRAEVSQVIANIIGEKAQKDMQITDVQEDKWYNDAVQTVLEKGIFVKDNDGKFNPENKITRAELFTVIARLKNIKQLDKEQTDKILSSYKDGSSVPTWARGYVAALIEKGIVKGSDNNINANEALTRQELATIFAQIIK